VIDNLHPHPNADRLQLTTIEGNNIVLGIDTKNVQNCEHFEIAVNVHYLIDAIRLSSEADKHQSFREIKFEFTENCRPMAIKHVMNTMDGTTRVAVVMPMALW
jgi:DNA polymerase III sliding clamp (beta) subunit (PCNA family)